MLPLDVIHPVEEAWRGSVLPLAGNAGGWEPLAFSGRNDAKILMLVAVAFLLIVLFRRVASTVIGSFMVLFSDVRKDDVLNDTSRNALAALVTILLIPIYSYILTATGVSSYGIWMTILTVASLFVYRALMFLILKASGGGSEVGELRSNSDSAFILLMALSLPAYIPAALARSSDFRLPAVYLAVVAAVCIAVYLVICCKRLISARFSIFFCFLYLCTLEILPIAVVVKTLVS